MELPNIGNRQGTNLSALDNIAIAELVFHETNK